MNLALEKPANTKVNTLPGVDRRHSSPAVGAITALPRGTKSAEVTSEQKLTEIAHKLVSQTFFAQMLKQMRDDPFKSEMFSGGRGEKAFGPMYDSILADRMAKGAGEKLVRPIVQKYLKAAQSAYQKQKEAGLVDANRRA